MLNGVSSGVNIQPQNNFGAKLDKYVVDENGNSYFINPAAVEAINDKYNISEDKVSFKGTQNNTTPRELTLEDKKEIKHKARNNATGWSIFGGLISTAYYGLRSDKTIADKYNLDVEKDKDFIKEIRKDQTLWTLPGALTQGPLGLIAWIYSKCQDGNDMTIKSEK